MTTALHLRNVEASVTRKGDKFVKFEAFAETLKPGATPTPINPPKRASYFGSKIDLLLAHGGAVTVKGELVQSGEYTNLESVTSISALHPDAVPLVVPVSPVTVEHYNALTDACVGRLEVLGYPKDRVDLLRNVADFVKNFPGFTSCPGAISHHHATYGGLLHHTVGVVQTVLAMGNTYHVDRVAWDIALIGAYLHDIGKTFEYGVGPSGLVKLEGLSLLGHIFAGAHIWAQRYRESVPKPLLHRVAHVILAHHGSKECGSPVEPCTLEALLVHQADMMDAKLDALYGTPEGEWIKGSQATRMV